MFSLKKVRYCCTGRIERGVVKVFDENEITGLKLLENLLSQRLKTFRKQLDQGPSVIMLINLLRGIKKKM
jgi:elongation factor Tu